MNKRQDKPDVTDPNAAAADPNSSANPAHAAAAANIGAEPAPQNIRNELTSGGNTEKFINPPLLQRNILNTTHRRYRNHHRAPGQQPPLLAATLGHTPHLSQIHISDPPGQY